MLPNMKLGKSDKLYSSLFSVVKANEKESLVKSCIMVHLIIVV